MRNNNTEVEEWIYLILALICCGCGIWFTLTASDWRIGGGFIVGFAIFALLTFCTNRGDA